MKAVVVQEGKTTKVEERPVPGNLKPNEVLFKVITVAQSESALRRQPLPASMMREAGLI